MRWGRRAPRRAQDGPGLPATAFTAACDQAVPVIDDRVYTWSSDGQPAPCVRLDSTTRPWLEALFRRLRQGEPIAFHDGQIYHLAGEVLVSFTLAAPVEGQLAIVLTLDEDYELLAAMGTTGRVFFTLEQLGADSCGRVQAGLVGFAFSSHYLRAWLADYDAGHRG